MTRQRVQSLILAILMALLLTAPDFSVAFAESQPSAPTESATQAPANTKKPKQYKVKFVDQVTGTAIGETQIVNAGESAVAPEAPDHSDLGFQFAGWDKDFSSIKKNLSVSAKYATTHQIALGDFNGAKAAPGGKLRLALPVAFKNALTGDESASNKLANGSLAGYDAKREIPEYDQSALVGQGIEWIRIDLDMSGTPLKADKDARSAYILKTIKDSKKKYGIANKQPVNRGFAVFDAVKARENAKVGTYTLKGAIVWRLKGTKLDNKVPFEIELTIGGAAEKAVSPDAAKAQSAAPDETALPDATTAPESEMLVANQAPKATPVVSILGSEASPEPTLTLEPTLSPEATFTAEPTATPDAAATMEPTATPGAVFLPGDDSAEPDATPDAAALDEAASVEPTTAPETDATLEPSAMPEVTVTPEATAPVEPAAAPEPDETLAAMLAAELPATPIATDSVDAAGTPLPEATAMVESTDTPIPEGTAAAEVTDTPLPESTADLAEAALAAKALTGIESKDEAEVIDGTAATYTVTFVDYDGSTITTTTVDEGNTPSTPGEYVANVKPIKRIDGVWSVFSSWFPELGPVTGDISLGAHYAALPDPETITYVDSYDGATLGTDKTAAELAANAHASLGYKFTGWKEEAQQGSGMIDVTATAQYDWTAVFTVCPRTFATGKPKGKLTIALPISYAIESSLAYSDTLAANGKRAEKYTGKETYADFNQTQLPALGVQDVYIELDAFSSAPLTAASLTPSYVVQGGQNNGYAVFDGITVKSSATNGYYTLTGKLYWKMTGQQKFSDTTFTTQVRVTGASTSSGGSSYSGGSTTGNEKPQPKLVVEAITTDPLSPKAGQGFDVVLSLKNTSPDYYVQNIEATYTTDEDALMPTTGSNSVFIAKIDKNESYELRLPVKASPELSKEDVKIDLSMEYEDKKLTALTATQSVMVKVAQVQRMQLDELQLPATAPTAGDSVQFSLGVFNLGRTVLYNVTAKVISDNPNLMPGQAFFGGNMDPGTSKTAELEATAMEAGQYAGNVQVTFENAFGDVTTETRPFSLTVSALEDFSYDDSQYDLVTEPPVPETPSAAQIMQFLPPWLYAAVGLALLLVILAIAMSARRRRRRMFEDDEMD